MKKFLILFIMIMPLSTYGIEDETTEKYQTLTNHYVVLARVNVDLNNMTFPYVISIPAPPERVIGVSGPTSPNNENWEVSNGTLKITYSNPMEFDLFAPGDTPGIEVATDPLKYYTIILDCY